MFPCQFLKEYTYDKSRNKLFRLLYYQFIIIYYLIINLLLIGYDDYKTDEKNRKHSTLFLTYGYSNYVIYTIIGSIVYSSIDTTM